MQSIESTPGPFHPTVNLTSHGEVLISCYNVSNGGKW